MHKKQLLALFICSLIPPTIGNGLFPLLPVYASQLGAEPAWIGYYLAMAQGALALGTFAGGWLSDRWQRRKPLLLACSGVVVPALWLLGQVNNVWLMAGLLAVVWFFASLSLALTNILTGLFAEPASRGRIFGFVAITWSLGAIIGGWLTGAIVERWGFAATFGALALYWLIQPMAGLFLEDKDETEEPIAPETKRTGLKLSQPLVPLLLVSILGGIAIYIGDIGKSLSMQALGFAPGAVSSTTVVSGLISLPLVLLIGWLSDRFGRQRLLLACYATGILALVWLSQAGPLWHFWGATSCLAVMIVSRMVGATLITDLVPRRSLGFSMSLFTSTGWLGSILGLAVTGYAFQTVGPTATFLAGACLPLLAIAILLALRPAKAAARREIRPASHLAG